jgi:hypothetical protein
MANAKPTDVRAGWTIYRNDPEITLEVLNDRLTRAGYGPISPRTFGHYRHLVEHGYDRYISINRFDVARASRPYEGAGGSARYRFYDTELPVTVVLTRPQGVYEAPGVAEKVGEVGALITFEGEDVIKGLRRSHLAPDDYVQLRFDEQSRPIPARVTTREIDEGYGLVEVEFTRLQPISEFVDTEVVPTESYQLLIKGEEPSDRSADLIGRRMYFALEALEACRAMANEVLDDPDSTAVETVGPPQITQLRLVNPLVIDLTAAGIIGAVLTAAWRLLKVGPAAYAEVVGAHGKGKIDSAAAKKIEAEARHIDARTEAVELQNDLTKEQLRTQRVLHSIVRRELKDATASDPTPRFLALQDELWESLFSLQRQDVRELEIDNDGPDEQSMKSGEDHPTR